MNRPSVKVLIMVYHIKFTEDSFGQNVKNLTDPTTGPVKLIRRVKKAHSFFSLSNQFHVIILSMPM